MPRSVLQVHFLSCLVPNLEMELNGELSSGGLHLPRLQDRLHGPSAAAVALRDGALIRGEQGFPMRLS